MPSRSPARQVAALAAAVLLSACASEVPDTAPVAAPSETESAEGPAAPTDQDQEPEATAAEPTEETASPPASEETAEDTSADPEVELPPDVDLGNRTGPGSLDAPLSPGDPIELTNWEITNLEVTRDATERFREEMGDLAPWPRSGYVYVAVSADFTRTTESPDAVSPGFDLSMDVIGGSGEFYDDHTNCPVFIDDEWGLPAPTMGQTVTGTLCLHVPEDDLEDATLMITSWWQEDDPLFVAID